MATVALEETTGFCSLDENPFGPDQEYQTIPDGPPARVRGRPGTKSGTAAINATGAAVG
jgi:hypothetical protein